jgi:radical SAM superfamily enzyme YgiQ (UPF0313 family)
MEILLANSYFLADDPNEQAVMRPYPPLGLLYVSAYLKREGHAVSLFDGTFSQLSDFRAALARRRPPLVGLYANILTVRAATLMIAEAHQAGATVILGGPDPSADPETYLAAGADLVVLSEGEHTAAEIAGVFEATAGGERFRRSLPGIAGITFLDQGNRVNTPARGLIKNLDELPLPDREGIDLAPYLDTWRLRHGRSSLTFVTSRGCPFHCTWCSKAVFGDSLRKRSVSSVLAEVRQLKERYGVEQFWIADDVFSIDKRWTKTFCRELLRAGLATPFECETRVDVVDSELLELMAASGCFRIWYGAESGSDKVLREMKKGFDLDEIRQAVALTRRAGISIGMFLMIGYPNEKRADVVASARMLQQVEPDEYGVSIAFPIKGTPFYERVKREIGPSLEWKKVNDPNLRFQGRYPHRFYWLAARYIHHSLAATKLFRARRFTARLLVHLGKTAVASVGMWALAVLSRAVERRWLRLRRPNGGTGGGARSALSTAEAGGAS